MSRIKIAMVVGIIAFLTGHTMPFVSVISRLVATNSRLYRLTYGSLRHYSQPVTPGTIEVVPATTKLWLGTTYGYSRRAWKSTPDASFCDTARTHVHSLTPVELRAAQSNLDDIVPVLTTSMQFGTDFDVAHQHYNFAAQDAVQEMKLDVDCGHVPCNSGTVQVVPLSNFTSALNGLIWLSSHVSDRTDLHNGTVLLIGYGISKGGSTIRFVCCYPLRTVRSSIESRSPPCDLGNYRGSPQWSIMHCAFKPK